MRSRASCLLLLASLVVLPAAPAAAQQAERPADDGRTHFEVGARAYDVGDYELAVREFRAAYEASHHPDLLYNVYAAAERLGRLEEARDALTGFLRDGTMAPERRVALEQRLARLEARIAEGANAPPPAETEPPPELAPEPPPAPAPAPAPEPSGPSTASVALLATSGGLLVTFGVFAALSTVEDRRLDDSCGVACTDGEVARLRAFNGLADASWIGAAAAGAVGLTLLFVQRGDDGAANEPAVAVVPVVDRRGAGLALEGRF